MKILHIIPYYKPAWGYGGPIQSVSCLAEAQARNCEKVMVITTNKNVNGFLNVPLGQKVCIEGVDLLYYPLLKPISLFFSPRLLMFLYRNIHTFDAIHIHCWWNFNSVFSILICWLKGIKPVFSPHGMLSPYSFSSGKKFSKRFFHAVIGKRLIRKTKLHAISLSEEIEFRNLIPGVRAFSLPILLDLPHKKDNEANRHRISGRLNLIFLSRIHPKKGIEYLFEALQTVDFPWTLDLVGSGEKTYVDNLQRIASEMCIAENIRWLGWINGDERYQRLAKADLMVLCSQNENFANVVLESLSVGTPVLISAEVGLKDFVLENNLGWVVDLNVKAIQSALKDVFKNENHCAAIRRNAPDMVQSYFSHEILVQKYIEAYRLH